MEIPVSSKVSSIYVFQGARVFAFIFQRKWYQNVRLFLLKIEFGEQDVRQRFLTFCDCLGIEGEVIAAHLGRIVRTRKQE